MRADLLAVSVKAVYPAYVWLTWRPLALTAFVASSGSYSKSCSDDSAVGSWAGLTTTGCVVATLGQLALAFPRLDSVLLCLV